MSDERMRSVLDEWFADTDPSPPSAQETADRVMARLPQTRQRGRWMRFGLFRPKARPAASSPSATEATAYQLGPIPAGNGHTPTATRRTTSMLSPVKAITAGAIVFAIGGAVLLAQPGEQQRSTAPEAASGTAVTAPVTVTGRMTSGNCGPATIEWVGAVERSRGLSCQPTVIWSDPRLEGVVNVVWNTDYHADGGGYSIANYALSIENDDGGWRMRASPQVVPPGSSARLEKDSAGNRRSWILDGEGAYEGLVAALVWESWDVRGVIVAGDIPPSPENASTE